ncbi:protein phosphatase CheZ [Castellaniella sp.]|uniref:protein phosphatase CheZ n=1 Tax=Castellaniella sp. TaxID=1955812 RepID=UPI00355EE153
MTIQLPGAASQGEAPVELLQRIAQLTRTLRESMRELGLDQTIKEAASAIPDARDRLDYVASMTEQAANRVLNAAEEIQPWQTEMLTGAQALSADWQGWFDAPLELEQARALVDRTRGYLDTVSARTQASQDRLMTIILAQDFQDLTGQVISRMLQVIGTIESELLQVLIDHVPQEKAEAGRGNLVNGPVVAPKAGAEVVSGQDQVDDLLASLGF